MKPINVEIQLKSNLDSDHIIYPFTREVVVTFEVKSLFGFVRHREERVAIFPDTERGKNMATKVEDFYKEEIEKSKDGW